MVVCFFFCPTWRRRGMKQNRLLKRNNIFRPSLKSCFTPPRILQNKFQMRVINRCPSAAFSLLYVDILRAAKTSPPASSRRAASRQRRQFSCLLMLSDCSNQAPSCRAVGKAPDPDQKQQRESKTLHRRSPLMNACIHNAEGREINESV